MIIATVKKLDGTYLDHSNFSSESEALAWFQPFMDKGIYGKKETKELQTILIAEEVRGPVDELVRAATYDAQGNELEPALYVHNENGLLSPAVYEDRLVVVSPADYEIIFEDISDELQQAEINAAALKYLAESDWFILREMDEGTPCPAEIKAERAAARARIVR